jgi:predicted HTH transcriptional regulator
VAFSHSLREPETAVLFIGVENKSEAILGVDDPQRIQMRVAEAGEEYYRAIRPTMMVLRIEGKNDLAAKVEHSRERPHFSGPAYIRSGPRSLKAAETLYRDLLTSHCDKAGELLR